MKSLNLTPCLSVSCRVVCWGACLLCVCSCSRFLVCCSDSTCSRLLSLPYGCSVGCCRAPPGPYYFVFLACSVVTKCAAAAAAVRSFLFKLRSCILVLSSRVLGWGGVALGWVAQGAQVVYLTSRPIVLAPKTRAFLMVTEQDGKKLPLGPLRCCLEKVRGVLWREVRV